MPLDCLVEREDGIDPDLERADGESVLLLALLMALLLAPLRHHYKDCCNEYC